MFASSLFVMLSQTVIENMCFIFQFMPLIHPEPEYNEIHQLESTLVLFPSYICSLTSNIYFLSNTYFDLF